MASDSSSLSDSNEDRIESSSSYCITELLPLNSHPSPSQITIIELAEKLIAGEIEWVNEAHLCHIFDYRVNINMHGKGKTQVLHS